MNTIYGLVGKTLAHSFSKKFFTEKFQKENIPNTVYELFELKEIEEFPALIHNTPGLNGLNVTIPYKEQVMAFISELDTSAEKVGAVNVINISDNRRLKGFNSDYYGFKQSLQDWLPSSLTRSNALILGTGGSSRAVKAALDDLGIEHLSVSRNAAGSNINYETLKEHPDIFQEHRIIINTTPMGMYPNVETVPDLNFEFITRYHFLFDLVYNPQETLFLKKGLERGAKVKNGLEMLHLQAEKSWEIWNS